MVLHEEPAIRASRVVRGQVGRDQEELRVEGEFDLDGRRENGGICKRDSQKMEVYAKQTQKKWRNMQNGHRKNREIRKQDGGNDEMVDTKDKQMGEHVNGNGDVNATGEYRDGGYKN